MSGWTTNGVALASLPLTGNERFSSDTQLTQGATPITEAVTSGQLANLMGGTLPMVAGRFYGVPRGATPGTLLTVTGTLYAYPFYITTPTTIKTIALDTTTGQTGGSARIGIYADNGVGYPGALVPNTDGGALIATSGAAVQTNTINVALNSGWYWLASIYTATTTFPTVASVATSYSAQNNSLLGSDTALHLAATSAEASMGVSVAATFGALSGINSGSFPTGATLVQNADVPLIILGV